LKDYHGVLTLESFSESDFLSSVDVIKQSLNRIETNPKSTFILGGARSGKSTMPNNLQENTAAACFTWQPLQPEMKK
jgi:predicted ATPase